MHFKDVHCMKSIYTILKSSLVYIKACRPLVAKPLPGQMLIYCQSYPYEQTSVKFFIKIQTCFSRKCILNMSSTKWYQFCSNLGVLMKSQAIHTGMYNNQREKNSRQVRKLNCVKGKAGIQKIMQCQNHAIAWFQRKAIILLQSSNSVGFNT